MRKNKTKFISFALASAVIAVGYSTAASADSVTSSDKATVSNPILTITPRMNVEFQGGGYWTNTSHLTYIQNTGSGVLYYDRVNHKYVFSQTRGAMGAAIYVFNAQGVNWYRGVLYV